MARLCLAPTIHLCPIFERKTGMRSVRYLTFHRKFISGMQAVRLSQLGRTLAPRSRLEGDPSAGSAVQLVGDLRDLAALVAGALELVCGRQA
jgi:hypothetical protein